MEVGDQQESEEMAKTLCSAGRLVNMDFCTFSLFLHGGWGLAEK